MTNDTRTSDDIERDIAEQRAQMSDTFKDLQKKFSVDSIVTDLGTMFRGQGGEIGRAISDTVGRNPAAVVLVGVGLAWLFLGQDRKGSDPAMGRHTRQSSGRHRTRRGFDENGPDARRSDGPFRSDDPYWFGDGQMSPEFRAAGRGARGRATASDGADGLLGTIQHAAGSVGDAVSEATGSLGQSASDLTERLSHGLEQLSDEAKARVVTARRAAHDARVASEAVLGRGSRAASGFFADQPLVVGALAVAVGAAIAGVLPHSRIEDDTMGNSSDQLFADAQALFHAERKNALSALKLAATDVQGEIRGVRDDLVDLLPEGKTVGDVIVDRTSGAVARVFDRAVGEVAPHSRDQSNA